MNKIVSIPEKERPPKLMIAELHYSKGVMPDDVKVPNESVIVIPTYGGKEDAHYGISEFRAA